MKTIRLSVDPGVCGFCCLVEARPFDKHRASIKITGSRCELIRQFSHNIQEVTVRDLFMPHTSNPVYKAAAQAGCHLTCVVPVAVLKAAEASLELALPRDVRISFVAPEEEDLP